MVHIEFQVAWQQNSYTFTEGGDGSNLICMSTIGETVLQIPVSISISTADIPGGAQGATAKPTCIHNGTVCCC